MNKKKSESVHQEFARYMRDEMDNIEKNLMDKKEN